MRPFLFALALLMPTTAIADELLDKSCLVMALYLEDPEIFAPPVSEYYTAVLDGFTADLPEDEGLERVFSMVDVCQADMSQSIREAMAAVREQS